MASVLDMKYTEVSSHYMGIYSTSSGRFSNDEWEFNLPRSVGFGYPEHIANVKLKNLGSFDFFKSEGNKKVLEKWLNFFKNQCENNEIKIIQPKLEKKEKKNKQKEERDFNRGLLASKILRIVTKSRVATFYDPLQHERMYLDPNSLGECPFKNIFPDEKDWNHNGVVLQKTGTTFKDYELALTCFIKALKKNPSFEHALTNKKYILKVLGWEDGNVFELFKKNILSKLKPETRQILEALSEKLNLGIQLEKEIEPIDDSTYNKKLSIMIKDGVLIGLGIFNCTEEIPDIIGNLITLQYLYLYGGRKFFLKYIPESIKNLTVLKKLSIYRLKEEYSPDWLDIFKKKNEK